MPCKTAEPLESIPVVITEGIAFLQSFTKSGIDELGKWNEVPVNRILAAGLFSLIREDGLAILTKFGVRDVEDFLDNLLADSKKEWEDGRNNCEPTA